MPPLSVTYAIISNVYDPTFAVSVSSTMTVDVLGSCFIVEGQDEEVQTIVTTMLL